MSEALIKKMNTLPDYIKANDMRGTEHLTKEDLQMPRMALAQALSPQLQTGDPKEIEGLKAGQFFNNLTGEIYGPGPFEIAVVRADPPRGVEFNPMDEGGGIRDFDVPRDDPRMKFGPNGEKPTATLFYDYIVVKLDTLEPVALSLKSTGLKTARQLNSFIKLRGMLTQKFELSAINEKKKGYSYFVPRVKMCGVPSEDQYALLESMYEGLKDRKLVIDREPVDTEEVPF